MSLVTKCYSPTPHKTGTKLHTHTHTRAKLKVSGCRGGVSPSQKHYILIRMRLTIRRAYLRWYRDYAKSWKTEKSWFYSRGEQKIPFSTSPRLALSSVPASYSMGTYLLTYLLHAAESFFEKLTSFQLVKKFPAFYETWRFITAFTSARHLSLSWARSIHSTPPHPTFLKIHLNIILPSNALVSQVVSFLQVSPPKSCTCLSPPHTRYMPRPSNSSRLYHPNNIWWGVQIIRRVHQEIKAAGAWSWPLTSV